MNSKGERSLLLKGCGMCMTVKGKLFREENYHNYRLDGEMKIFILPGALKNCCIIQTACAKGMTRIILKTAAWKVKTPM
jgi:hypothetical protein